MILLLINDTNRPSVLTTSYGFTAETDIPLSVAMSVPFLCFLSAGVDDGCLYLATYATRTCSWALSVLRCSLPQAMVSPGPWFKSVFASRAYLIGRRCFGRHIPDWLVSKLYLHLCETFLTERRLARSGIFIPAFPATCPLCVKFLPFPSHSIF
jgi:hypothetical protein